MFEWFHKCKIAKLSKAAKVFVNANYKEPPKPKAPVSASNGVQYSLRDNTNDRQRFILDNEPEVQYSLREKPKEQPEEKNYIRYSINETDSDYADHNVQYSVRDNYNSQSIDRAVRSLSSTNSPLGALRTLENNTNMSFVDKMLDYINAKHMRDSDVYKAAQIDRRLFSKIVSDRTYKPAKDTCIALSLALQLSLTEANDILSRAGYVLSHSSKRDVVIEYFFREHIYDLNDVNEILFKLDQKLIGR